MQCPISVTPMSESIQTRLIGLLDPKHVGVGDKISLLSYIQAEICVIAYVLPVDGSHAWFASHSDVKEYPNMSHCVTVPQKYWCTPEMWVYHVQIMTSGVMATILNFCGVAQNISILERAEECARDSPPIGGNCMTNSNPFWRYRGRAAFASPRRLRDQKTSRHPRIKSNSIHHTNTCRPSLQLRNSHAHSIIF